MGKKEKQKKLQEIVSTQMFSPIRDIQRGIIITKDGRYIKLMEFSPINFGLRTIDEQNTIIAQFTAALRIMPKKVHFKVLSTRADVTRFTNSIDREMETEKYLTCRELQTSLKQFILDMSSTQGVARRFFIDFEYEEAEGFKLKRRPTFQEIYAELNRMGNIIRISLERCGNRQVSIDDSNEYIYSALHAIMSRGESAMFPFEEKRHWDVLARYGLDERIDFSQPVHIPPNDFFCPGKIDSRASSRYIVVDGVYYMHCYVPSSSYPSWALGGWPVVFINLGVGIDFDFWFTKENIQKAQTKLQYALRWNKIKARESEDTSQDYEDILAAVYSGYYFKQGIASNEDFCYMGAMITITADSLDELNYKWDQVKTHCIRNNMKIKQCWMQQLDAFTSTLPICAPNPSIWAKSRRNILTRDLGSAYPLVSYEMCDDGGILLGVNHENRSLVFVNIFDQNKYTNANTIVIGSSGSGKSFLLLLEALRLREKHVQTFQITALKSKESERVCQAVGGTFVKIQPGSAQNINIMEIRPKDAEEEKYLSADIAEASILMQKIQQLHVFFSLALRDITFAEDQLLDKAILETYERYGINEDNSSLEDPMNPGKYKKMPIIGDLYEVLLDRGDPAKRLCESMEMYVSGSLRNFNSQTNVELENEYVVLDVSGMSKELLPMGMFLALDFIWDKAKENRTKLKTIFIDEAWGLIGKGASSHAAQYVLEMVKTIRGCGGAVVLATQDINDFFALDEGTYGAGILNNCKFKFILKTEASEAARVAEVVNLSKQEWDDVLAFERGTALLLADTNHIVIDIKATPEEHQLITTKREDLLRIAQQRMMEEQRY